MPDVPWRRAAAADATCAGASWDSLPCELVLLIASYLGVAEYRRLAGADKRTRTRLMTDRALDELERRCSPLVDRCRFGEWMAHAGHPRARNATGSNLRSDFQTERAYAAIALGHLSVSPAYLGGGTGIMSFYGQLCHWANAASGIGPRVIEHMPVEAVVAICNPLWRDLERLHNSVVARLPLATAAGVINHPDATRTNKAIVNFLLCRRAEEYGVFFAAKSAMWKYVRRFPAKFYDGARQLSEQRQLALLEALPAHKEEWRMLCRAPYLSVVTRMAERDTLDIKTNGAKILEHSCQHELVPTVNYLLDADPALPFTSGLIHFAFDPHRVELWNRLRADPRFTPAH